MIILKSLFIADLDNIFSRSDWQHIGKNSSSMKYSQFPSIFILSSFLIYTNSFLVPEKGHRFSSYLKKY